MNNSALLQELAIGISSQLQSIVVQVTPADERIIRVRLKHTRYVKKLQCKRCSTPNSTLYFTKASTPPMDTLIATGDFNTTTGTDRTGYERCVVPYGNGNGNINSSLLTLARSRRFRIMCSWYQRLDGFDIE